MCLYVVNFSYVINFENFFYLNFIDYYEDIILQIIEYIKLYNLLVEFIQILNYIYIE